MSRTRKESNADFVLDIETNAFSSLSHGIEHFVAEETDDNLKFAILHVFHAVELILKARLAKAHPLLIYTRPEVEINDEAHTVDFKTLVGRLKNVGVDLSVNDIEELRKLQSVRNSFLA